MPSEAQSEDVSPISIRKINPPSPKAARVEHVVVQDLKRPKLDFLFVSSQYVSFDFSVTVVQNNRVFPLNCDARVDHLQSDSLFGKSNLSKRANFSTKSRDSDWNHLKALAVTSPG